MWARTGVAGIVVVGTTLGALIDGRAAAQEVPELPVDVPVWLVGHPGLDGSTLMPYQDVRFSLGRVAKAGPLRVGERIEAAAYALHSLTRNRIAGRDVWVRTARTYLGRDDSLLAQAEIVLDAKTLAPLRTRIVRGGVETIREYDWVSHVVRRTAPETGDDTPTVEHLDLTSLEAGAHETWMAALPWDEDFRVMLPSILAGGGGKWWAVPRVVASEPVDLGDGRERDAWVVALDWWGMGQDQANYTPGDGVNDTAGAGGKYWVLKQPAEGLPRVVRIRTEVDQESDNVVQIQDRSSG